MSNIIIGLTGAKGSGKDHFFHTVKKNFPLHDVRKIAYADPIKNELMHIFNLETEQQYDDFKRTQINFALPKQVTRDMDIRSVDGRHVVREIGMLMRRYDENQFTKYVEQQIESTNGVIWCITDLRFQNELDSIKNRLGGIVVKIKRVGFDYDGHVTETEFADDVCDHIIHNQTNKIEMYERSILSVIDNIL